MVENLHGLTGVQQDILRTAMLKADELKGFVADVTRENDGPLSVRNIKLFNSHIDAALQYLRGAFNHLPESFGGPQKETASGTGAEK